MIKNALNLVRQTTLAGIAALGMVTATHAETSDETRYPVVFAHGMAGFVDILGHHYFGDDLTGAFVGDACSFMELNGCNGWVSEGQQSNNKAAAFQVSGFHNSEVRGERLFNHVRNFIATTGHAKVNLVGHSQGGMDIRKVAHRLKATYGVSKVAAAISISSPHRGTSVAKRILDLYARKNGTFCGALPAVNGADPCLDAAKNIAGLFYNGLNSLNNNTDGNDVIASLAQFVYDDYDANDGKLTGARAFNEAYPVSTGVADYFASLVTGQDGSDQNPLLLALGGLISHAPDGDGYCVNDCDNDGAAGTGNGNPRDNDDDGLVPVNSQQMGVRLQYNPNDWRCTASLWGACFAWTDPLDSFSEIGGLGYTGNLNAPSAAQMTSRSGIIVQDHLDVISLGPDMFDENEFYAGLIDFMQSKGF